MAFTLRKDTVDVPVAGYQDAPDAIDVLLWAPLKIVDEIGNTDANGDFIADNKPFIEISRDQNRVINGYDITAKKTADGATIYIKEDGTTCWGKLGKVRLYTDAECTTIFADASAKVTYWTLVGVKVDSDGKFEVVNTDMAAINTAVGAVTDVEAPSGDASIIAILKNLRTRIENLETYLDGVETKQDTLIAKDFATQTTLANILAKLSADPATQTTLVAILAKLSADPATQTTLAAILTALGSTLNTQLTGSIVITPSAVTVGIASGLALAANSSRRYASFQNDSDTVIYLMIGGGAAVLNQGVRLNPNGGSYEMSPAIGNLYLGAINAIHGGSGNKNLLITEGV